MYDMDLTNRAAFDKAVELAKQAATQYYDGDGISLVMTDAEYDQLVEKIEQASQEHPDWGKTADTILNDVAAGASAGGEVEHPEPMLSLSKSKTLDTIISFADGVATKMVVEPKMDGLAIRAEYDKGTLKLVATRGDGRKGENVTDRAQKINGLPLKTNENHAFEVRGEVYMTNEDFVVANQNRIESGRPGFSNPRNATAGSLRREDSAYEAPMSFVAYDASGTPLDTLDYSERMTFLENHGIHTALGLLKNISVSTVPTVDSKEIVERIGKLETARDALGYPIDGAVVKVDSIAKRNLLGSASRSPRWATAYKYAADTTTTIVKDIETTVGRTGQLGIRIVVEPVSVGGATITYATGHNVAWMLEQNIGVGTKVSLYRAGDVIPRAISLPESQQPTTATKWTPPATCPQCGGDWDKSSLLWRCHSPECGINNWIEYACSRDVLDIEGASEAFVTAVVEAGLVNDPADLYDLSETQIANLVLGKTPTGKERKLGSANAKKIHANIQRAKTQPVDRQINSLNIRKNGRTMSRRLAQHFHTMANLQAATIEQLSEVEGIAEEKAHYIHDGLLEKKELIAKLANKGVNMGTMPAKDEKNSIKPLSNEIVVVTGSMASEPRLGGYNRNAMNELIEKNGGRSSGSVSSKTTLLVCGEEGSSKYKKAVSLGIPILSPTEFADKLGI